MSGAIIPAGTPPGIAGMPGMPPPMPPAMLPPCAGRQPTGMAIPAAINAPPGPMPPGIISPDPTGMGGAAGIPPIGIIAEAACITEAAPVEQSVGMHPTAEP